MEDVIVKVFKGDIELATEPVSSPAIASEAKKNLREANAAWIGKLTEPGRQTGLVGRRELTPGATYHLHLPEQSGVIGADQMRTVIRIEHTAGISRMVKVGDLVDTADLPDTSKPRMKEALRVLGYEEDEEVGEAFMMLTSTQLTSAGLNVREANAILAKAAPPTDQMRTVIREELVRHDESQSKSNKSFSEVGSSEVDSLLVELNLNEVDGNAVEPIIVPADAPQPGSFAYENYPDENTGTPFLLAHHQKELERHDVHFGRNDFKMYDIHSERKMYGITARSGQRYNGSLDGCAAPYGLMASSAGLHSRLAYKHKQNEAQKQIYRDKHSDHYQDKDTPSSADHITFSGAYRARSVTARLGAYAYNNYPLMIDLTDGVTHHLLQIRGDEVYVWTDLTAAQAYFKQAELLKSLPTHLPNRQLKMEAIPEELQVPLKKMRTLRTRSGVVEQLSSVLPCLPPSERLSGAYDIINTWVSAAAAAAPLP